MVDRDNLSSRCHACIEDLNRREGWHLTSQQIAAYVAHIVRQVPEHSLQRQMEQVVRYFHRDYHRYVALRDERSPHHRAAWDWVKGEIIRTAQFKGLGWSWDRAVDIDDLVQTVQAEFVRSIGNYHFESSLRTWLQGLTMRRLRRFHRDTSAAKRTYTPEPIEAAIDQAISWDDIDQDMMASALLAEIIKALNATGDERYAYIFYLRTIDDQTTEQIGEHVRLHPSRVRALLKIIREVLQQNSSIRIWNTSSPPIETSDDTHDTHNQL